MFFVCLYSCTFFNVCQLVRYCHWGGCRVCSMLGKSTVKQNTTTSANHSHKFQCSDGKINGLISKPPVWTAKSCGLQSSLGPTKDNFHDHWWFSCFCSRNRNPTFCFFSFILVTGIVTSPSAVFGSLAKLVEGCTPGCLSACLVQRSEWGEVGGRNNWWSPLPFLPPLHET